MSILPVWGTGIAPVTSSLRRRVTSEGDLRVDTDGNVRVASIPPVRVEFLRWTSQGDQRVTSQGDRRITRDGLAGPQYYQTANVPSDGGEPFGFSFQTGAWQPSAQGGENIFAWAYVTLSWSMGATVRVTGLVDDGDGSIDLPAGATVQTVRSTFELAQQSGTLQRVSQEFPVPLVRRITRNGVELTRVYQRGQRLALLIESTGPLGVGELMLVGVQVDVSPVRKAQYAAVDSTS